MRTKSIVQIDVPRALDEVVECQTKDFAEICLASEMDLKKFTRSVWVSGLNFGLSFARRKSKKERDSFKQQIENMMHALETKTEAIHS